MQLRTLKPAIYVKEHLTRAHTHMYTFIRIYVHLYSCGNFR